VLAFAIRNVVLPTLGRDNLGVRIGLDYGRDRDVLWSSYGYPGVDEVTATSFFVDVAAKLQQAAGIGSWSVSR
jgi:adenylate cyclase